MLPPRDAAPPLLLRLALPLLVTALFTGLALGADPASWLVALAAAAALSAALMRRRNTLAGTLVTAAAIGVAATVAALVVSFLTNDWQ